MSQDRDRTSHPHEEGVEQRAASAPDDAAIPEQASAAPARPLPDEAEPGAPTRPLEALTPAAADAPEEAAPGALTRPLEGLAPVGEEAPAEEAAPGAPTQRIDALAPADGAAPPVGGAPAVAAPVARAATSRGERLEADDVIPPLVETTPQARRLRERVFQRVLQVLGREALEPQGKRPLVGVTRSTTQARVESAEEQAVDDWEDEWEQPVNVDDPYTRSEDVVAAPVGFDRARLLTWLGLGAVVLISGLLYLPNIGSFGLWDPWEVHYGEVARHMTETRDYISPWWGSHWHRPGEGAEGSGFFSKPILLLWSMALGLDLWGWSDGGVRVGVALMAMIAVALVYMMGASVWNRRTGLVMAGVLTTSPFFFFLSRQAQTDMPFVSMLVAAMALFMMGAFGKTRRHRADGLHYGLFFVTLLTLVLPQLWVIATDVGFSEAQRALRPGLRAASMSDFKGAGLWEKVVMARAPHLSPAARVEVSALPPAQREQAVEASRGWLPDHLLEMLPVTLAVLLGLGLIAALVWLRARGRLRARLLAPATNRPAVMTLLWIAIGMELLALFLQLKRLRDAFGFNLEPEFGGGFNAVKFSGVALCVAMLVLTGWLLRVEQLRRAPGAPGLRAPWWAGQLVWGAMLVLPVGLFVAVAPDAMAGLGPEVLSPQAAATFTGAGAGWFVLLGLPGLLGALIDGATRLGLGRARDEDGRQRALARAQSLARVLLMSVIVVSPLLFVMKAKALGVAGISSWFNADEVFHSRRIRDITLGSVYAPLLAGAALMLGLGAWLSKRSLWWRDRDRGFIWALLIALTAVVFACVSVFYMPVTGGDKLTTMGRVAGTIIGAVFQWGPVQVSIYLLCVAAVAAGLWCSKRRTVGQLCFLGFYIFAALATMAKGLLGFALPGAIALFYLIVTTEWRRLREFEIPRGILVFIAVGVPWYAAMLILHGEAYFKRFFIHDHFKRLAKGVHQIDSGTIEHFIHWLGYGLFPWAALVPAVMLRLGMGRGLLLRDDRSRATLMLALWATFTFALFSISSTKFHHYIFPVVPPLALLVGLLVTELMDGKMRRFGLLAVGVSAGVVLIGWDVYVDPQHWKNLFTYMYDRAWIDRVPSFVAQVMGEPRLLYGAELHRSFQHTALAVTLTCAAGALLLVFANRWVRRGGLALIGGGAVALTIWGLNVYMPAISPTWSQRGIWMAYWEDCTQVAPPPNADPKKIWCEESALVYRITWRGEHYYSQNEAIPIQSNEDLAYFAEYNGDTPFYVMTDRSRYCQGSDTSPHFGADCTGRGAIVSEVGRHFNRGTLAHELVWDDNLKFLIVKFYPAGKPGADGAQGDADDADEAPAAREGASAP